MSKIATPKYRFIPHPYMQDVAAQLASKTPHLYMQDVAAYIYDLPELAKGVQQMVLKEAASKTASPFTNVADRVVRPTISKIAWRRKPRLLTMSQLQYSFS
jgi:hypothetical protein